MNDRAQIYIYEYIFIFIYNLFYSRNIEGGFLLYNMISDI